MRQTIQLIGWAIIAIANIINAVLELRQNGKKVSFSLIVYTLTVILAVVQIIIMLK